MNSNKITFERAARAAEIAAKMGDQFAREHRRDMPLTREEFVGMLGVAFTLGTEDAQATTANQVSRLTAALEALLLEYCTGTGDLCGACFDAGDRTPGRWGVLTGYACDKHRESTHRNEIGGIARKAAFALLVANARGATGGQPHYPPGMGEESRRLHREYNALVEAQRNGAKNGAEVVRLTDECAAKGIVLVPGGENL